MTSDEPQPKRARYAADDDENAEDIELTDEERSDDEGEFPSANKAIHIRTSMQGKGTSYNPEYTHQLFPDEQLHGYPDDTKVTITFDEATLHALFHMSASEVDSTAEGFIDLQSRLLDWPIVFENIENPKNLTLFDSKYITSEEKVWKDRIQSELKSPAIHPVGTLEYTVNVDNNGEQSVLEMYRWRSPLGPTFVSDGSKDAEGSNESDNADSKAKQDEDTRAIDCFMQRLRSFLVLDIDGGSFIDPEEPGWHIWNVWKVVGESRFPVGFSTVFEFFHFPEHSRFRLAQLLLAPWNRRKGYGYEILSHIRKWVLSQPQRFDMTIEDPSDQFQRIRDTIDFCDVLTWVDELTQGKETPLEDITIPGEQEMKLFPYSKDVYTTLRQKFGMSQMQSRKIHDVLRLHMLNTQRSSESDTDFRISVKRRLYQRFSDQLDSVEDLVQRKQVLHELWEEEQLDLEEIMRAAEKRMSVNN